MRMGLQVPRFTYQSGDRHIGETFANIAQRAEHIGFASLWVMDHFFQIRTVGKAEEPMLEGYSALAYAAGRTNRIMLGTLVTGVTYRHPGLLVKTVTTLDVLSGGRAYFGVGAAWNEQEHRGLGVPFPPTAERFERLEETLQIALQMWSRSEEPYQGKHYQLERPLTSPQSIQRPHPPILIGGQGEQKTLRLVAQYADACNLFARTGEEVLQHKLEVLQGHCQRLGRPYDQIQKTALDHLHLKHGAHTEGEEPTAIIERYTRLAALGFDEIIISLPDVEDPAVFDVIADQLMPEISKMPVATRAASQS